MMERVLNLAKSVERRIWFTDHPLLQVPIHREVLTRIVVRIENCLEYQETRIITGRLA